VCSESIISEFARITHKLNILYCYPLMERTRSSDSSHSTSSADLPAMVLERIEAFFPFDPYTLPRSRLFVDAIYVQWEGLDDDEEEQSEHVEAEVGMDALELGSGDEHDHAYFSEGEEDEASDQPYQSHAPSDALHTKAMACPRPLATRTRQAHCSAKAVPAEEDLGSYEAGEADDISMSLSQSMESVHSTF
jgi:hypothetical protein